VNGFQKGLALPWTVWLWGVSTLLGLGGGIAILQDTRAEVQELSVKVEVHNAVAGHAVMVERVSSLRGRVDVLEARLEELGR